MKLASYDPVALTEAGRIVAEAFPLLDFAATNGELREAMTKVDAMIAPQREELQ